MLGDFRLAKPRLSATSKVTKATKRRSETSWNISAAKSTHIAAFNTAAGMISRRDRQQEGRMLQRLVTIAAWTFVCFLAYATLCPIGDRPTLATLSSREHLAAFAVFGGVFCLAYPRRTFAVLMFVLGTAALLEVLQLITPDRHARTLDALQKIAGGAAGVFAGRAILYFERARSWFQV
ncbi:VanZ family protein [Bradyrhizobium sp. I1.14.4]|uniref:VanZ family protein n=1 Tax=unclassified Bradyrhizobium TaxID=2631580 RepID=UPI003D197E87